MLGIFYFINIRKSVFFSGEPKMWHENLQWQRRNKHFGILTTKKESLFFIYNEPCSWKELAENGRQKQQREILSSWENLTSKVKGIKSGFDYGIKILINNLRKERWIKIIFRMSFLHEYFKNFKISKNLNI